MPTEYYFKNEYLGFHFSFFSIDYYIFSLRSVICHRIKIAELLSLIRKRMNSRHMASLPLWVKRRHIELCKIWKYAAQKQFMYILTMWYWILLDFKNILKFMNFIEF